MLCPAFSFNFPGFIYFFIDDKMKIFEIETQKIILGEAIATLTNYIPDDSIDLIFVDPPYNIGKKFNRKKGN